MQLEVQLEQEVSRLESQLGQALAANAKLEAMVSVLTVSMAPTCS